MLVTNETLVKELSPRLDPALVQQLVDEFVSLERRYIQCEWEPMQLDGGQFCEILGRIIYFVDSGNLSPDKKFEQCESYVKEDKNQHHFPERREALHLMQVLRTVYKFRSQRGAVHISLTYKPNHMDSKFVVDALRWAFSETLRIFWNGDREQVASAIRELLQFDVPAVGKFETELLVQRTDLSAEEEILLLLHYAGETGFDRGELGRYVKRDASQITRGIQALEHPRRREIIKLPSNKFRLTDLGSKFVREKLGAKLTLI
jgi:hypothetical protein